MEFAAGFAFVGRQVHLEVGGDDFYIDLLLFHIPTDRYVVVELKVGKFKPEHLGQLNFYVSVMNDKMPLPRQRPAVGILVCGSKNEHTVRYALDGAAQPLLLLRTPTMRCRQPNSRPAETTMTHWALVAARKALRKHLDGTPSIAVLTRTNVLAGRISETLAEDQLTPDGKELPAIDHVLAWDPELAAASALVVASILEWPFKLRKDAVTDTLRHIADYYRTKIGSGTQGARTRIITLERAIEAVHADRMPSAKTAKVLLERFVAPTERGPETP